MHFDIIVVITMQLYNSLREPDPTLPFSLSPSSQAPVQIYSRVYISYAE